MIFRFYLQARHPELYEQISDGFGENNIEDDDVDDANEELLKVINNYIDADDGITIEVNTKTKKIKVLPLE